MSTTCHRCGALDPAGTTFRRERIPFLGTRVYCPQCHVKFEANFLLGILLINIGFGVLGSIFLLFDAASECGHVYLNVFLIQITVLPSVIVHEFAHAIAGNLSGLTVWRIWIGRGKTFWRANIFGFDTEFKLIPVGGFTFFTHGPNTHLRLRYFVAILAGPFSNLIVLATVWNFVSWRNISFGNSVQFALLVVLAQILILVENLLPYRIQTALGRFCTDGLSLFQLVASKMPDILNSPLRLPVARNPQQTLTR